MSSQAFDSTKKLALALSDAERADLASTLIASLDGPADTDAAEQWEVEILRRVRKIDEGGANFVTPEELRERIQRRLRGT